ncbi:MAG: hypothetical protein V2J24_02595 [Pseudomonadales bacterium]|jgi:Zn-finger nucleic acid-binding protein|nr:hypothetical protein [Pseudomonadales bacterium]
MHCYSCEGEGLKPTRLAAGLPARECARCGGVQVDLLAYRAWREAQPEEDADRSETTASGVTLVKASDNRHGLVCQRCAEPMQKYRIDTDVANFVDLCERCDDVWLDGGEWELLKHLHLSGRLTEIMTEPWQRRIHLETARRQQTDGLRERLGAADHDRLLEVERWLDGHPESAELLRYLRTRFGVRDDC